MDKSRSVQTDAPMSVENRTERRGEQGRTLEQELRSAPEPKVAWIREGDSLKKMPIEDFDHQRHQYRATAEMHQESRFFGLGKGKEVGYVYEKRPGNDKVVQDLNEIEDIGSVKNLAVRVDFSQNDRYFPHLASAQKLEKLELRGCTLPEGEWGNHLAQLKELDMLSINNPSSRSKAPSDNLAGLQELPKLRTLALERCEFLNGECYEQVGHLSQLTHLDLTRTITREKAPGVSGTREVGERSLRDVETLDPRVMGSLQRLIEDRSLKTLDIHGCSALGDQERQQLHSWGKMYGCVVKE
jgi:hypothetical protein